MLSSSRQSLSLDGSWQFRTDPEGALQVDSPGAWRPIDVPGPWQAQGDDLRFYQGVAWYRRTFEIPLAWAGKRAMLHFGAVDYQAEVFVNGTSVGTHIGGYLPFEFDITDAVTVGQSAELVVRVLDPDDDRSRYETPFSEISHGKQSWYGPLSGIWQSVTAEARPALHITTLQVTADVHTRQVTIAAELSVDAPSGTAITAVVSGPDQSEQGDVILTVQGRSASSAITLPSIVLWDLDNPALYTVTATVQEAGADRVSTRFGFRTIETREGSLWLNDKPLMLRGALDQDYYPDGICTPPSYEFLVNQAQLAKRMGLNCLRCHIKLADPRYLAAADEVGILVWAELPNWEYWTPEGGARGVETLSVAILRDWNHPSVVIWSVINESWGIDQTNPEHRAWLVSAFDAIKAVAGDRLVVDNSACFNNFHLKSDLDDYHFYAAMPDERLRWREWVQQFAARPRWSYGAELPMLEPGTERWPLGDAGYGDPLPEIVRTGDEPLIVSEFGNWGLPSLADLRGPSARDPWWFETGDDWGAGVVYPHGVEQRFSRLGLGKIFGDYERFSAATRRAELDSLRFEIEEMRRHPSISGYVITEFTDVHWECNGLLDMRRNPKMPLDALATLNADTVLIPDREGGALWAGEQRSLPLLVSHWGAQDLEAPEVRLSSQLPGGSATFVASTDQAIAPRSTVALGEIQLIAPAVSSPMLHTLRVELWSNGFQVTATELRLPVYPRPTGKRPHLYVEGSPALRERLLGLGYTLTDTPGTAVTVATQFDDALRARVQAGEHVILLAESESSIAAPLGVRVAQRAGTAWQGSWASSFAWLSGEWAGDGILDESFMQVMPTHVVVGFAQQTYPTRVEAGLCVGWIQDPAVLLGHRRLGRGLVTVTTFRLAETVGDDPVATLIFERLVASDAGR
jgi:hypothetical protein